MKILKAGLGTYGVDGSVFARFQALTNVASKVEFWTELVKMPLSFIAHVCQAGETLLSKDITTDRKKLWVQMFVKRQKDLFFMKTTLKAKGTKFIAFWGVEWIQF